MTKLEAIRLFTAERCSPAEIGAFLRIPANRVRQVIARGFQYPSVANKRKKRRAARRPTDIAMVAW